MQNYQIRKKIHPKQSVAVLLKEDYENGNLTYGIVDEILTKTETHYRGIKVKIKFCTDWYAAFLKVDCRSLFSSAAA